MRQALFALLLSLFATTAQAQTLVLVTDVSQSMNTTSLGTQFQAYATLLTGPLAGQLDGQRVVVIIFGHSTATVSNGTVDDAVAAFTALASYETRNALIEEYFPSSSPADDSYGGPNRGAAGARSSTCVGGALIHVKEMLPELPTPVIVDISGDGVDNCGSASLPSAMSQDLLAAGVVINSLPMGSNEVAAWYEANVTTGFQITAWSISEFEEALFSKLMTEISMLDLQKN